MTAAMRPKSRQRELNARALQTSERIALRFALAFLLFCGTAQAETYVIDGDTFDLNGERIRLFGIDAPEKKQPGGAEATAELRRLMRRDPVCKEVHRDRYERTVSLCAIDGTDLSLAMIRAGQAVAWCAYRSEE